MDLVEIQADTKMWNVILSSAGNPLLFIRFLLVSFSYCERDIRNWNMGSLKEYRFKKEIIEWNSAVAGDNVKCVRLYI